ncbi:MAG: LOG family protein [Gammaproteobacteria bacterium]|nr:LOG family protein [Gammaproteobacteria bacterium]MCP5202485.1 LOG family protein [Gammaproteobacteria bacterium]
MPADLPRPDLNGGPHTVVPRARVAPLDTLALLSQREVNALCQRRSAVVDELFRRCALAVLSSGLEMDDPRGLLERYAEFEVALVQEDRGLRLDLRNAPGTAFVDGHMIRGVREHLFAVLRDIIYINRELALSGHFELDSSTGITDAVFRILRHASVLDPRRRRGLVVCWGGHAIGREEYDYTKEVGYALGLRLVDVCTGCGPGAMKGPMKGAAIAHAKQRVTDGRYIGITEPGIIAAEAPNPIVNQLVIMPDMEKRLEAFVRIAHGIVIFPGGVGTAEELLYLLGVLANPRNAEEPLPIVLTGPPSSAGYFSALDTFIREVLGPTCAGRYEIIIGDPDEVAQRLAHAAGQVMRHRDQTDDACYFNWRLAVDWVYQVPFEATHPSMASLTIRRDAPVHELAANLRRLFSGIVAGNVKETGIAAVEKEGPFRVHGDIAIMNALDALLRQFVDQGRMRLPGRGYEPCYEIVV